jgi:hypothetical protein
MYNFSQSWAIGARTAQTLLPRQRFFGGYPYEADSLNIDKKVAENHTFLKSRIFTNGIEQQLKRNLLPLTKRTAHALWNLK